MLQQNSLLICPDKCITIYLPNNFWEKEEKERAAELAALLY